MHVTVWLKVLQRLSPVGHLPEARLVCSLLAYAINDEPDDVEAHNALASRSDRPLRAPFVGGFWERGFPAYCRAIGLDPQQVMQMVRDNTAAEALLAAGAMPNSRQIGALSPMQIRDLRNMIRTSANP